MATKLKRLVIDRVDLVDRGANPDAHIALFKRAREPDTERSDSMEKQDEGWLTRVVSAIAKKLGLSDADVAKMEPMTVGQVIDHDKAMDEFWTLKYALSRSLESIMECDKTMEEKVALMGMAVGEFAQKANALSATMQDGDDMYKVKTLLTDVSGAGSDVAKVQQIVKALEPPSKPDNTPLVNPLLKKKDGEDPMTLDEFMKSLSPEKRIEAEAEIAKRAPAPANVVPDSVTKRLEELEKSAAKVIDLEKRAIEAEAKVSATETKLAKAETELGVEREYRINQEYLAKGALYPSIGDAAKVSSLLRKAYGLSEEYGKEIEDSFAKAEVESKESNLFKSIGSPGRPSAASTEARIEKMAVDLSKEKGVTFEKAYDQVLLDNPDMYRQMRAEKEVQ